MTEVRPTWLNDEDVSAALAALHVHACAVGAKYVLATYVPSSDVVSVHHNAPHLLSALAFVEQTIINVPTSLHYMNHQVDVGPIPSDASEGKQARTFVLFPPMGVAEWHQAQAERDFAAELDSQDEDEDDGPDEDELNALVDAATEKLDGLGMTDTADLLRLLWERQ